MTYARHLRVVLSGEIRPNATTLLERWSMRLNMSAPGDPTDVNTEWSPPANFSEDGLTDVVASCTKFISSAGLQLSQAVKLTEVKMACIDAFGHYSHGPLVRAVSAQGGAATAQLFFPPQVALAVSLRTARRGPTGRGRFYLPCPSISLDGEGRISAGAADAARLACQTFLQELNNWPGVEAHRPVVTIASSKGYNSDVTGVCVGRVYDTIRSRREALLEAYNAPLPVT